MNTKKILFLLLLVFLAGRSIAQPPPAVDSVYGYIFRDIDGDCIKDDFEAGLDNWTIQAAAADSLGWERDTFYGTSDANGYYFIQVPHSALGRPYSDVILTPIPPQGFSENCIITCEQREQVVLGPLNSYVKYNIGLKCDTLPICPVLDVNLATIYLHKCFQTPFFVNYRNTTSLLVTDPYVEVTIDPDLTVVSADLPYTVNGNVLTFQLNDLGAFESGVFSFTAIVSCDVEPGKTLCTQAHIFPDTCQGPQFANWDGSRVEAGVICTGDEVQFTLRNVGTEDMSTALDYIVIEDNVLLMQSPGHFQLNAGEEQHFNYPADGSFFRLEAQQSLGAPGGVSPLAWVEGCGNNGNPSLGYVNQYSLGDDSPTVDEFCMEVITSYDPNDKQGFPRGVGEEHYIDQNVDLEYMIRFQNTGTAAAINVEIRDAIPTLWLDPTTVRPGAASHPYTFDMDDNGALSFKFNNINLPDSTHFPEASQGFVTFRVSQRKDLPIGTQIKNSAGIYFDFNAPVITNETLHTIGKDYLELSNTQVVFDPQMQVKLAPNPVTDRLRVSVSGLDNTATALRFRLISPLGAAVVEGDFTGNYFEFNAGRLPAGVYGYEIYEASKLAATGKVLKL